MTPTPALEAVEEDLENAIVAMLVMSEVNERLGRSQLAAALLREDVLYRQRRVFEIKRSQNGE